MITFFLKINSITYQQGLFEEVGIESTKSICRL